MVTEAHNQPFSDPKKFLGGIGPLQLAQLLGSAADITLVIEDGIIQDVSLGNAELTREDYGRVWPGKPWVETVKPDSRDKVSELIAGAKSASRAGQKTKKPVKQGPAWRQVNHSSQSGLDLPVRYTVVKLDDSGRLVAFGRDLRSVSLLQQRLVEAHQSLERDYSRLRSAEARYKLLFESISQAVLIFDPVSFQVLEANPAAEALVGEKLCDLVGHFADGLFAPKSFEEARSAILEAQSSGSGVARGVRLESGLACDLNASAYRDEQATRVILRLTPVGPAEAGEGDSGNLLEGRAGSSPMTTAGHPMMALLEDLPDGLFVVGADLRIVAANRAFVELAQLVNEGQLKRVKLSDVLGRSSTELNVLISNLKRHGVVRNFATLLRDRFGHEEEVEVSAVGTGSGEDDRAVAYGFSVRSVARRLRASTRPSDALPSSVEQMTDLVGRVPMKAIVQESTDFIEKLCIEAALEISGDNRASAAEILGLSRQGLYSKLKRFGIDN